VRFLSIEPLIGSTGDLISPASMGDVVGKRTKGRPMEREGCDRPRPVQDRWRWRSLQTMGSVRQRQAAET